jgi:hypothetical protein
MSIHYGQQNKKRRNGKKMGRQRSKTFKIKSQICTDMSGDKGYMSNTITTKEGNMVTISVPDP